VYRKVSMLANLNFQTGGQVLYVFPNRKVEDAKAHLDSMVLIDAAFNNIYSLNVKVNKK
jgi:hypothetical protein